MNQRNSDRRALTFPVGVRLMYILTGVVISLSLLLANDRLYQGNEQKGDPLLVLTCIAGMFGGALLVMHWHNKLSDYALAVIGYASIGLCIGATIIGTIYDAQSFKWFGLVLLIAIPAVAVISRSKDSKPAREAFSKQGHKMPGFGK